MKFPTRWILAITCLASGVFGGFLLTGMPHLTTGNWLCLAGIRVLWQLGGGAWFGWETASLFEASRWKFVLPFATLGGLLCINPLLDIVRGPETIEGHLANVRYVEGLIWTTRMPTRTLTVKIEVVQADGEIRHMESIGSHASQWSVALRDCAERKQDVRLLWLRHLESTIKVDCVGTT